MGCRGAGSAEPPGLLGRTRLLVTPETGRQPRDTGGCRLPGGFRSPDRSRAEGLHPGTPPPAPASHDRLQDNMAAAVVQRWG